MLVTPKLTPPATMPHHRPSRLSVGLPVCLFVCLLALMLLPGCDAGSGSSSQGPTSQPSPDSPDAGNADPAEAFRVVPSDGAATSASPTPPPRVKVAGHELLLPPARLRIAGGEVTLVADTTSAQGSANTLYLTFTPDTDGTRPWKHAVYSMELASLEPETPDGLYVGSPDNHLRPARLEIELFRDDARPGVVNVLLKGELIPADATDLARTGRFSLEARFDAAIEQ